MRVAVLEFLGVHQRAALAQHVDDVIVRGEHVLAGEQLGIRQEAAVVADRVVDLEAVLDAGVEVVLAVAGRGVHRAGAGIEGDVIAEHHDRLAVVEWMTHALPVEQFALTVGDNVVIVDSVTRHRVLHQFLGEQQTFLAVLGSGFDKHVLQFRVQRDRQVGRQRPRRRGPDHHRHRAFARVVGRAVQRADETGFIHDAETHVDRGRSLVAVIDLGLGQRRTAIGAPVHRFVALGNVAVFDDLAERANDVGLGFEIHRQVRVVPVAEHAEADEVLALVVDLRQREFAAGPAKLVGLDLDSDLAELFLDLVLDRQAVAVPAGHVGRILAVQRARLDDHVLEDLVDRVADVDVAVGVGRAVVQHVALAPGARVANLLVKILVLPILQALGLALGEIAAHRELGIRQV